MGKISNFPSLRLYDAYAVDFVQNTKNPADSSYKLTPIRETIWSPKFLELNSNQVIFYGELTRESDAYRAIETAENEL